MLSPASDSVASTARAFATYSLVPYLGILFCPGAVLVGAFGVVRSYRSVDTETKRSVYYLSAIIGFVLFVIQVLLWWILYKVPIWARGF